MGDEEVVALLRRSYGDEIETAINYLTNSIILDGVEAEEIKDAPRADIQEELGHAKQFGERLKQLDAQLPESGGFGMRLPFLQPPDSSTDVIEGKLRTTRLRCSVTYSMRCVRPMIW